MSKRNFNRNNILKNWEIDNDPYIKTNEMLQPQYHELQKAIFCRDNNICLQRIEKMEMCALLISNSNLLLDKDNDWLKCQLLETEAQKSIDYKQLFQSLLPLMSATLIHRYSTDARYLFGIMTVCSISMGYKIHLNYKWHRHESCLYKLLKICQDLQKISQKFVYWIGVCWKLETIIEDNETIEGDPQKQAIILSLTRNLKELINCFHRQAIKVATYVNPKMILTQNYSDFHSTSDNYIWKLFNKYMYNRSEFFKILGYYYCLNKSTNNKLIENILNEMIKSLEKCINDLKNSFEAFQNHNEIKSEEMQLMSPEIYNLYVKTQEASSRMYSMHQTTQKILKLCEQINAVNITHTISDVNKEMQNLVYNGNLINNLVEISKMIITNADPELKKPELNDSEIDGSKIVKEKRKREFSHSENNGSKKVKEERKPELSDLEIEDPKIVEERKPELSLSDMNGSKTVEDERKPELNHSEIISSSNTVEEKRVNSYLEQRYISDEIPKEYLETSKIVMNELKSVLSKKYNNSTSSSDSDNDDSNNYVPMDESNLSISNCSTSTQLLC